MIRPLEESADLSVTPAGQDVVFHVATAQYFGGEGSNSKKLMHGVNVLGTQNVIDACVIQEVPKLVYTSSASVVFEGKDLVNVDETAPYAAKPMDYYTGTKARMCGILNDLLLSSALPTMLLYNNHLWSPCTALDFYNSLIIAVRLLNAMSTQVV